MSAVSQFGTEELFWKKAVLHSHHVASPSEWGLHDQDLNTWHAGTVKYLLVGDCPPMKCPGACGGSRGGTGPVS